MAKIKKNETPKRLYKSADNRLLCGVCGGIAEYIGVDATLLRLVVVLATLIPGIGGTLIVLYVIGCIIIPENPATRKFTAGRLKVRQMPLDKESLVEEMESHEDRKKSNSSCSSSLMAIGIIIMLVGAFYYMWYNGFITPVLSIINWRLQWPFAVIAGGAFLFILGLCRMIFRHFSR